MSELSSAIKILTDKLNKDDGYRYSWQANIAVQFKHEWQRTVNEDGLPCTLEHINEIANNAADNFLKLLCREVKQ